MAVVENAAINSVTSSNPDAQQNNVAGDHPHHQQSTKAAGNNQKSTKPTDQNFHLTQQKISNGHHQLQQPPINGNGVPLEKKMDGDDDGGEGFKREMRDLEEMLSKLNPMAEEFVPPSLAALGGGGQHRLLVASPHAAAVAAASAGHFGYNANGFVMQQHLNTGVSTGILFRRDIGRLFTYIDGSVIQKKNGFTNGKRRMNSRTSMAQREDVIRRTVYVSDIDHQVVDCRVCGDPNSVLRFAFIEFTDEEGARNALSLAGTMLGYYPVRVLPSKTAIAPVNPTFLPRSEDEREMCARTIYCTNIDKKVTQADVKLFFESICGEVHRLRLLGDYHHSTRIAFVEFVMAESAIAALNCSGAVLGSLPIRVSPSKTPVRPRAPRQTFN
ncbi:Polyadenylate-binding protein-interacting protein 11 [Sesamum angolense]|uniref:Polyadenylate-binding protein-interacting protein 11 n=1 Tax=Sesamum angolense TaxID=2727404 RepID=A0AAE1VZT0_9LAMI|nr:Polyadenylate-binding protein-interacting protein 11 [Sesamum angolense]